jgi:CheY-like chemotaxis protein
MLHDRFFVGCNVDAIHFIIGYESLDPMIGCVETVQCFARFPGYGSELRLGELAGSRQFTLDEKFFHKRLLSYACKSAESGGGPCREYSLIYPANAPQFEEKRKTPAYTQWALVNKGRGKRRKGAVLSHGVRKFEETIKNGVSFDPFFDDRPFMAQPVLILYIDDDQEDIEIFKSTLAAIDSSIICLTAHNGQEGLDILSDGVVLPDLVFLDINMPILNGRDCLVAIRKDQRFKDIPIIMYSTSTAIQDKKYCLTVGANEYLCKSGNVATALEELRGVLMKFGAV